MVVDPPVAGGAPQADKVSAANNVALCITRSVPQRTGRQAAAAARSLCAPPPTRTGRSTGTSVAAPAVMTPNRHDKVFQYETNLEWQKLRRATSMLPGAPPIELSPPRDFGGEPGRWAPEQLLLAAVESCTLFTFLAEASRQNIEIVSWGSSAEGTVARAADGRFEFTHVVVRPVVVVKTEDDAVLTRALLQTVGRRCFIGNSLKAEPRIEGRVEVVRRREPLAARPAPAVEGPSS